MPAAAEKERLLPLLRTSEDRSETTVYITGFLAPNDEADDFDGWRASHALLAVSHDWCRRASGYRWPSGSLVRIGRLPVPVTALSTAAWRLYRRMRGVRRTALPVIAAQSFVEELVVLGGRLAYQYALASRDAVARAEQLAERLARLRKRYERVRVVAHSLGCRHLIEATQLLDRAARPDEIHLCAPALREDLVGETLDDAAREAMFVYFCRRDLILGTAFRALALGAPIGAVGLAGEYDNVVAIDTDANFGWWVHREYPAGFHAFAGDQRRRVY